MVVWGSDDWEVCEEEVTPLDFARGARLRSGSAGSTGNNGRLFYFHRLVLGLRVPGSATGDFLFTKSGTFRE